MNGKNDVKTEERFRGVSEKGANIVSVYNAGKMEVNNNFFQNQNDNDNDSTFKEHSNRVIDGPSGEKVIISKWQISSKTLKSMINSNNNDYIKVDSENSKYVWFSLPCILHNANTLNTNYSYVALNTAYDAVCGFHESEYDGVPSDANSYDFGSYDKNIHITPDDQTQSIINLYDNKLYLPVEILDPHEVYVRHVECDASGNIIKENGNPKLLNIYNSQEIKIDSNGKESLINNTTSKIPDNKKNVYQEYYNISLSDKLKVSRSLTIALNKTMYNYKGYTVSSASTLSEAEKQSSSKTGNENMPSVTVTSKDNKKTVTIVTFKYTPETITIQQSPQGGVKTLDSSDSSENCQMAYTPTDEEITPYLVANKFKLIDLKYEYIQNNDKVQYSINTFNIYKLISGTISNNDSEGTVGQIFGGSDDRWTLFEGTSQQVFPADYGDITEITTYMKNYSSNLPPQSELNSLVNNSKTNKSNFPKKFKVPENRYNGLRIPKLIANYESYDVINKVLTGTKTHTSNTARVLVYNPIKLETPTVKSEGVVNHSTNRTDSVIQKNANFVININAAEGEFYTGRSYSKYLSRYYLIFDIDIVKTANTEYTALYNTSGYDLQPISKNVGDKIPRGTLIELKKDATTFKAKASNNSETGDIISQGESNITLIGVSNNMPGDLLRNYVLANEKLNTLNLIQSNNYISIGDNTQYTIDGKLTSVRKDYCDGDIYYTNYKIHDSTYYNDKAMYGDAYYFAKAVKEITNIGRIYDFKVTDCSDVDYKSTFRKTGTSNINELTGIQYFSGLKEFSIYSNDVNVLVNRENSSISSSNGAKTIIPLGPYKSTNTSYINAPKMGYRISFDLKTSGYYKYMSDTAKDSTREILIKPSYYYISKDGKTFKNKINLYYKNSSGKYVSFVDSDYTIYFKPKDGYRSISNSATAGVTDVMSDQLEPLVIGSSGEVKDSKENIISTDGGFVLNYKMMSTADNNFVQAWYGEFKLPNSTIAVESNNISKPLTNGYIGVIFDITCIDIDSSGNQKRISYNTDNQNANPKTNTTQWDYEGFIGFDTPGQNANNLSIQLEKGTWTVNDTDSSSRTSIATYKDIKGTVVLFDTDNRAANDFD